MGNIIIPTTIEAEAALKMFASGTIPLRRGVMKLIGCVRRSAKIHIIS